MDYIMCIKLIYYCTGRTHDARVFTSSVVYESIINTPQALFRENTYIIAGNTYVMNTYF